MRKSLKPTAAVDWKAVNVFIKGLKSKALTPQQYKTLAGQAKSGDLAGAQAGLMKITGRRNR